MKKGSKMSKESCEKMRLAKLGKKHSHKTSNGSHWEMSIEAKEKIKKGLMGNKNGSGSKGKRIQRNNALEVWRKNGGRPWNAGTKGLVKVWNKGLSNEKTRAGAKIAQDALIGKPAWNRGKPATWITGEKSHLYKHGKSKELLTARQRDMITLEYVNWRRDVFERDDYTCQICGQRGGKLRANHIKKYADFPELRKEITNGVTVCERCDCKLIMGEEEIWEDYFNFNLMTRGLSLQVSPERFLG